MASIVTNLLTGGLLQGISGLINSIRGKSPEDAAKLAEIAEKYQSDILAADTASRQAQTDVNKAEASSPSIFVAGWRPFVGWVCGVGFGVQFVIGPLATWAASLFGRSIVFPSLDMSTLSPLLMGMLGLGAMRTYEKVSGVPDSHPLK